MDLGLTADQRLPDRRRHRHRDRALAGRHRHRRHRRRRLGADAAAERDDRLDHVVALVAVPERRRDPRGHGDDRPADRAPRRARRPRRSCVTRGEIVLDRVSHHYGRGGRRPARRVADDPPGREGRPRRPLRRRQVDARQPDPALLRHRGRRDPHRRPGRARASPRTACAGRSAWSPRTRRCCTARSAPTSSTAARRRREAEMVAAARRAEAHDFILGLADMNGRDRLRRPRRRARRQALGRPAAADRAGAGDPQGRADPDPRRGDERARQRGRGGDPGHALRRDAGQDGDRHRAPALDHRPHGPDRRARRRRRSPRRAPTPSCWRAAASTPASGSASPAASSTAPRPPRPPNRARRPAMALRHRPRPPAAATPPPDR